MLRCWKGSFVHSFICVHSFLCVRSFVRLLFTARALVVLECEKRDAHNDVVANRPWSLGHHRRFYSCVWMLISFLLFLLLLWLLLLSLLCPVPRFLPLFLPPCLPSGTVFNGPPAVQAPVRPLHERAGLRHSQLQSKHRAAKRLHGMLLAVCNTLASLARCPTQTPLGDTGIHRGTA